MTPTRRRRLIENLRNRGYRQAYFESHIDSSVAAQIKANRERRDLSQKDLAKKSALFQSQISKLEDVNHNRWTAKTLRRIARAFDLVLVIRFERFSKAMALREAFPGNLVEPSFPEDDLSPESPDIKFNARLVAPTMLIDRPATTATTATAARGVRTESFIIPSGEVAFHPETETATTSFTTPNWPPLSAGTSRGASQ